LTPNEVKRVLLPVLKTKTENAPNVSSFLFAETAATAKERKQT